ncbi:MAG: LytR C-terminal domain-containing protein [Candidatus Shapirobacteria bacterium]|nr:LytR C-terminal domain-containing protein [Candidatus Shapirobacteria bacterium]MDD4410720.1 LytR C-terminal domain-containing protein [Candidatus Shapirobacteria bacterium]
MSLFSKPKLTLWPKSKTVELYIDRKENNTLSFDLNLWQKCSDKDLESLILYFKQNKFDSVSVLIPDDVVFTKSFTYDTKIETIDKKEVISLAASLVNFKIDPDALDYKITQVNDKTIIQSFIYDKPKLDQLKENLSVIGVKISQITSVSTAISNTISSIYKQEFFLIYPLNDQEYTLLLSKNNSVYLTINLKGPSLDIQKIVNYSNFYFSSITKKIYIPEGRDLEIITTTEMDKTVYNESQIAQSLSKASNLPLPVLGEISTSITHNTDIIGSPTNISSPKKNMENKKKNILPIIAVFIFTAALASIIIWVVLNRNTSEIETPADTSEIVETTITPTEIPLPTPTIAEIDKTIKIQVLNATDINGQAATVKAMLTKLGFENIAVGNAKTNATENSVSVKSASTSAYFESALVTDFPATYTTDLTKTATYDAVFTIGTDLSTGASATTKVTPTVTKTSTKSATPTEAEE